MEKQSTSKFVKLSLVAVTAFMMVLSSMFLFSACTTKHEWKETGKVDATCSGAGYITYTCDDCGEVRTETIPQIKHNYVVDADQSFAATCAAPGQTVKVCSACGDAQVVNTPATGAHEEVAFVIEATCESNGYTEYTCSECGKTEKRDITAKLRHNYDWTEVEATCTIGGFRTGDCVECGVRYTDDAYAFTHPALGHKYGEQKTVAAGCVNNGKVHEICERCGDDHTIQVLNATKHSFQLAGAGHVADCVIGKVDNNVNYSAICANAWCDDYTLFNTTEKWVKSVPHTEVVAPTKQPASPAPQAPVLSVQATCELAGTTKYFCNVCNAVVGTTVNGCDQKITADKPIDALGHTLAAGNVCTAWTTANEVKTLKAYIAFVKANRNNIIKTDRANDQGTALLAALAKYEANDAQTADINAYFTNNVTDFNGYESAKTYAGVCINCGEYQEKQNHEWKLYKLVDGVLGQYEMKDGKPVEYDPTKVAFSCLYSKVCVNCNTGADNQGAHNYSVAANCRHGNVCSICNNDDGMLLAHEITTLTVQQAIVANAQATATEKAAAQAVIDAFNALKAKAEADETLPYAFLAKPAATCAAAGYNIQFCKDCVVAQNAGEEVRWNVEATAVAGPVLYINGTYEAATQGHDFSVVTYYDYYGVELPAYDCAKAYKLQKACSRCGVVRVTEISSTSPVTDKRDETVVLNPTFNDTAITDRTDAQGFIKLTTKKHNLKLSENWAAGVTLYCSQKNAPAVALECTDANCSYAAILSLDKIVKADLSDIDETYYTVDSTVWPALTNATTGVIVTGSPNTYKTNDELHTGVEYECGEHCPDCSAAGLDHTTISIDYKLAIADEFSKLGFQLLYYPVNNGLIKNNVVMVGQGTEETAAEAKALISTASKCASGSTTDFNIKVITAGQLFVKATDGKIFKVTEVELYSESTLTELVTITDGNATVTETDHFFVKVVTVEGVTVVDAEADFVANASYFILSADVTATTLPSFTAGTSSAQNNVVINLNGHKLTLDVAQIGDNATYINLANDYVTVSFVSGGVAGSAVAVDTTDMVLGLRADGLTTNYLFGVKEHSRIVFGAGVTVTEAVETYKAKVYA